MTDTLPLINVSVQPIELCKLLKIANMVGGGGEAKIVISEGYVTVNNEVEFQKRKKIYHDDIVEFNGEIMQVNVVEELTKSIEKPNIVSQSKTKVKAKKTTKENIQQQEIVNTAPARTKRKPISF